MSQCLSSFLCLLSGYHQNNDQKNCQFCYNQIQVSLLFHSKARQLSLAAFWEHFAGIKGDISIMITFFSAFFGMSIIEYLENCFVNSDFEPWYIVLKLLPKLCGTFNISFPKTISQFLAYAHIHSSSSEFEGVKGFSVSISGVHQMQKSFFGIVSHIDTFWQIIQKINKLLFPYLCCFI